MPKQDGPLTAVVVSGGKQYRVAYGDRILVDRLAAEPGAEVKLDRVLLVMDGGEVRVGAPLVEGFSLTARVIGHERGPKIEVLRYKSKKHVRVHRGARADLTAIEILDPAAPAKSTKKAAKSAKKAAKKDEPKATEKDEKKPAVAGAEPGKPAEAVASTAEVAEAPAKPAARTSAKAAPKAAPAESPAAEAGKAEVKPAAPRKRAAPKKEDAGDGS